MYSYWLQSSWLRIKLINNGNKIEKSKSESKSFDRASMNVYFQMAFDEIDIPDHDVSIGGNSSQERFA